MKTELTDNEIRVRIAEACGWRNPKVVSNGSVIWAEHPETGYPCQIPLYLTSLDAMHEAEKWLLANRDDKTWLRYVANLQRIAGEMERPPWVKTVVEAFAYAVHAKARQRALAFLATIAP